MVLTIQQKNISRKSIRKIFPIISKLGTEFRVRDNGRLIRTFTNRSRARSFIKKTERR